MSLEKQVKTLLVPFVLWYLRTIGRLALSRSRATVIGIAGSVGKTSTREALYAILKDVAPTHMVSGNSELDIEKDLAAVVEAVQPQHSDQVGRNRRQVAHAAPSPISKSRSS